jgi:group I intron endonuclease
MFIYLVYNTIDGKVYVGKHAGISVQRRWRKHVADARRGVKTYFYNAIRKYGENVFQVFTLSSWASSKEDLNAQEVHFIAKYRANDPVYGYNMTSGGDGGGMFKGRKHTTQSKQKIAEARTGKPSPRKGQHHTAEAKRKISQAALGNKRCLGRKLSEATKRKISEATIGRIASDELCRVRSENAKGDKNPMYGRKRVYTQVTLEKMRQAQQRRRARERG